ncbi:MAG TPA: hypothetical protein VGT44_14070 [Ktedonobacteraceae bacterium]|nr:hypothetical protein [Ktedonobacteraceae bacterium]
MTRKDEKDTERPHYYSQFWLDVAAGRREIGSSKTDESADSDDLPELTTTRRGSRPTPIVLSDGHRNSRAHDFEEDDDFSEPEVEEEEDDFSEPEVEEDELAGDLDGENTPDILFGDTSVPAEVEPVAEEQPTDEEAVEEEEYFDEEEEEDEDGWAARGRKKPKPGRQAKTPKAPLKKPKRGGRAY